MWTASAELHLQPTSKAGIPALERYSFSSVLSWLVRSRDPSRTFYWPCSKTHIAVLAPVPRCQHAAWTLVAAIYARPEVLVWSLWWLLAFCGLVAVEGYSSSIWYSLDPTIAYNGFVDASARLVAAAAAFLPMLLRADASVRRNRTNRVNGL